jgi:hypothetical protein
VFSCWTKTLDLIASLLRIRSVRIDGSFSYSDRLKAIDTFNKDPAVNVLLMTTGTGSVGYAIPHLVATIFHANMNYQTQFDHSYSGLLDGATMESLSRDPGYR